jgi:hypothetical protein
MGSKQAILGKEEDDFIFEPIQESNNLHHALPQDTRESHSALLFRVP